MPNIKVDWNQVSREVAKLGEDIFQKRIKGATDDALDFLKKVEKDVIKLNLQLTAGQITKEEFDDLMSDQKALAKMEALKQKGLTQVAIDQFVNGRLIFWLVQPFPRFRESCQVKLRGHRVKSSVAIQSLLRINGGQPASFRWPKFMLRMPFTSTDDCCSDALLSC